jgi:phenylalanyl-tRNA synthetase beta chain
MRLSINWLKDYLDLPISPEALADKLTLAGLEVEALESLQPPFQGVIAGYVYKVDPHPQADRLQVALVDDGGKKYQVVCGAPNLQSNRVYPFAPVGATLVQGPAVKAAQLRGVLSEGMLLAEDELGLSGDHAGLMDIRQDIKWGEDLGAALGLRDVVLEVAITPNRPDCLSIIGLAREVAALLDQPLRMPGVQLSEDPELIDNLAAVTIQAPDGCPRYAARLMVDLQVKTSPFWMRHRLQVSGIRAINNLVDITNYVLLEYGQPLHAFDFDRLNGGRIIVRYPGSSETSFVTLDGQERPLHPETLLICDGQSPVAVAGLMGGLASEVTAGTHRVLLESAYFQPNSIRRTAKNLGLSTEASYRFERGVDPEGVISALDRASQLMATWGEGRVLRGRIDVYPGPVIRPRLEMRVKRANAILGTDLPAAEMVKILQRLQMPPLGAYSERLEVQVPSYRGDLTREIDLIEEVARVNGFDNIPVALPRVEISAHRPPPEVRCRETARTLLVSQGFCEVINYSFGSERLAKYMQQESSEEPALLRLANPISEEQAVMRHDLLSGLLETARKNLAQSTRDLKIFEIAKIFIPQLGEELPQEKTMIAGLMSGFRQEPAWNVPEVAVDFYDLKGVVETLLSGLFIPEVIFQPARDVPFLKVGARIFAAGVELGFLGEIHPAVGERFELKEPALIFSLDLVCLAQAAQECPAFTPLPRYPAVYRDLALVLPDSIPHAQLSEAIYQYGRPWVVEVKLFDVYTGKHITAGQRSLAFHLCYRDPERTLTDLEVNQLHESLIRELEQQWGARLRT